MNKILAEAANNARGLAIDAIHKCSSGHLGLPLGSAEIGAVLESADAAQLALLKRPIPHRARWRRVWQASVGRSAVAARLAGN